VRGKRDVIEQGLIKRRFIAHRRCSDGKMISHQPDEEHLLAWKIVRKIGLHEFVRKIESTQFIASLITHPSEPGKLCFQVLCGDDYVTGVEFDDRGYCLIHEYFDEKIAKAVKQLHERQRRESQQRAVRDKP
jgi:hypothetical protein